MGGELAVIFIIATLTDMVRNFCPDDGCLAVSATTAHVWLQPGMTYLDSTSAGAELTVGLDIGHRYGPFQPAIAASVGDEGEVWIGFGLHWRSHEDGWFADAMLMPGLYDAGRGHELGQFIEFRSSLGLAMGLAPVQRWSCRSTIGPTMACRI